MTKYYRNSNILRAGAACLLVLGLMMTGPVQAKEQGSVEINKRMIERAERICNAVLPKWLASDAGMRDPSVREITANCYVKQAQLSVKGKKAKFVAADTDIVEVPAVLLRLKTGISLDIFQPLAGQELQLRKSEQ